MKKIAVVLCGSGFLDGSEIHESVGVLWALSQQNVEVKCFAPDSEQSDVMNCLTAQPMEDHRRNQLVEAARIARGDIQPLTQLDPTHFDAIVLPGGYGAAKNLCTFAKAGSAATVRPELEKILLTLHEHGKPIGAACIAPAIVALTFRGHPIEFTVGAESEASAELSKLGHKHFVCKAQECHVDQRNRIVTTPAYMTDQPLHEIFTGIQKMIQEVVRLTS